MEELLQKLIALASSDTVKKLQPYEAVCKILQLILGVFHGEIPRKLIKEASHRYDYLGEPNPDDDDLDDENDDDDAD